MLPADEEDTPKRPFYRLYNTRPKISPGLGLPAEEEDQLDEDDVLERGAIRAQDLKRSSPVEALVPPPRMPESKRAASAQEEDEEKSWITPEAFLLEEDRIESDEESLLQEGPADWKELDEQFLEEAQESNESGDSRSDSPEDFLDELGDEGEEAFSIRGSAEERSVLENRNVLDSGTRNSPQDIEVDRFQPVLPQSASGAPVQRDAGARLVELNRSREAFSNIQTELPRFGDTATRQSRGFQSDAFSRAAPSTSPVIIRHRAPDLGPSPIGRAGSPIQGSSLPSFTQAPKLEPASRPAPAPVKPVDRSFFRQDDFRLKQ